MREAMQERQQHADMERRGSSISQHGVELESKHRQHGVKGSGSERADVTFEGRHRAVSETTDCSSAGDYCLRQNRSVEFHPNLEELAGQW
jgi:hypothetical protein